MIQARSGGTVTRRWSVSVLVLLALQALVLVVQSRRERLAEANPLLRRVRTLGDGEARTLEQLSAGRPLLLVFWTTWCAYCAEELTGGADLAAALAAGPAPVEVLFVNVREHPAVVERHAPSRELAPRLALDTTGALARALGVRGYPTFVLLAPRGGRLWTRIGGGADVRAEVAARVRARPEPS